MDEADVNGSVWPAGREWPAGALPPPCLTVEISVFELKAVIEHHEDFGTVARQQRSHEAELFHAARVGYLRQRLAAVAPPMEQPHSADAA